MDLAEEEKQGRRGSRSSIDEPLLPPQYEERPSRLPSPHGQSRNAGHDVERILNPKRKRSGNGRFWTILFVALMGPALLGAFAIFFSNSYYGDGWISNRPHADSGSFPTDIGFAGPTITGKEAGLLLTAPAPPVQTAQPPLVAPSVGGKKHPFNIMQSWGHLSPWYSVDSHGLPKTDSLEPKGCEIKGLHWLQRHGARYPTTDTVEGPMGFAIRLKNSNWTASGDLAFLNDWSYKLGGEILTPFGRQQLFNLGVSARVKYGFLLEQFEDRLPVFRTESQDRMLKSAQNFAAGFFGIPVEDQYNLAVMIESPNYNCTLSPYAMCPNDNGKLGAIAGAKTQAWENVFLAKAIKRLQPLIGDYSLTTRDVKDMMEMCAYETVSVGYSAFCGLFTEDEWKGFQYRNDIWWWHTSGFGSPVARAEGLGYAQELISRLTHTRLTEFNSTTNSTWHDDIHFPLNDPIYVDFTHDTVFHDVVTVLNFTGFAASGTPPTDHIPKHRSYISSKISPFATNMQFQILSCPSEAYDIDEAERSRKSDEYIRVILNDAAVPLTGIRGCPENDDGKCPMATFVSSIQEIIGSIDFEKECLGRGAEIDYSAETTTGAPVYLS
ncbi:putative phytase [Filobasidium floriforme]|uniref:putative phytase n=1 Tax=Filobasidium floriforme TaxID=5210 RepID=UPI001E8D6778|nr:putative phytase [Filobasidium floriforme]KAH8084590.1 putative phytase [Filobasidium floriforme]